MHIKSQQETFRKYATVKCMGALFFLDSSMQLSSVCKLCSFLIHKYQYKLVWTGDTFWSTPLKENRLNSINYTFSDSL